MDLVLHEIFAKETAGHLAEIRKFIADSRQIAAPYPVTEDLHRSCHTLSGTAKTAGARQGIKITEPLNRYIRKLYDNSVGLPQAGLEALAEAVAAIQQDTGAAKGCVRQRVVRELLGDEPGAERDAGH